MLGSDTLSSKRANEACVVANRRSSKRFPVPPSLWPIMNITISFDDEHTCGIDLRHKRKPRTEQPFQTLVRDRTDGGIRVYYYQTSRRAREPLPAATRCSPLRIRPLGRARTAQTLSEWPWPIES